MVCQTINATKGYVKTKYHQYFKELHIHENNVIIIGLFIFCSIVKLTPEELKVSSFCHDAFIVCKIQSFSFFVGLLILVISIFHN